MPVFRYPFRVRYAETDQMGVSYYAHYFVWFEMGRSEYFRSRGVDYTQVEKMGFFLPVVEAFCRYSRPTVYDDLLSIEVAVSEFGKTSMRFVYQVLNQKSEKVAEGYTVHVFVDRMKKPVRVPQEILDKIRDESSDS